MSPRPRGERNMSRAERSARVHAHSRPLNTAYASALINDYEALVESLLGMVAMGKGKAERQARELAERAETRRRHLDRIGKPHLADPLRYPTTP